MKRVFLLLVAFIVASSVCASAQRISVMKSTLTDGSATGSIIITEDEGVQQAISYMESRTSTPSTAKGYRLVIYHDSEQFANERASRVLSSFRNVYKSISSYLSVESPTFRVLVGDCFNRDELAILQNYLKHSYPDAAISEVDLPLRILLRYQGTNNMRIERSGSVVTEGAEIQQLEVSEQGGELNDGQDIPIIETPQDIAQSSVGGLSNEGVVAE